MNLLRVRRPSFDLRRMFGPASAPPLWEKYGLRGPRDGPSQKNTSEPSPFASLPRAKRFRLALEETGGLYATFGQFLSGRADLLPGTYLAELRTIRIGRREQLSPSSLPELRDRIAQTEWVRSAPCSEIYTAFYQDQQVMVEVFSSGADRFTARQLQELERQLRRLPDSTETSLARPIVIEQFREWLEYQADAERKRNMLRNLQDVPIPCVLRFPRLVPELQSTACLVYQRAEGRSLSEALTAAEGSGKALDLWAESLLEQPLFFSILDADAQPENYLVLPEGGLGFRTLPAMVPVPVEWHNELLQYLTAAVAGNSHRAMQMVARICAGNNPYAVEQMLLERLSALEPELRVQRVTAESVVALESYWRALAQTSLEPPLFLELFHRNLTVLGQMTPPEAPETDVVSESLWPVMARILQFRVGDILSTDKAQEWLASFGLLLLTAVRQVGVLLEQVRDNDLALELERDPGVAREQKRDRRVATVIRSGIGLVLFLFSLQMAQKTTGTLQIISGAAAALCAAAVCILVARID